MPYIGMGFLDEVVKRCGRSDSPWRSHFRVVRVGGMRTDGSFAFPPTPLAFEKLKPQAETLRRLHQVQVWDFIGCWEDDVLGRPELC
jgi:hypothetical protein